MSGFSEFFRDENLVWACENLLPTVAQQLGRTLLIAEVGCSSGEETWSIAAQLKHAGVDFHVDAIDYRKYAIDSAQRAQYSASRNQIRENMAKNGVPDGVLDYFPGIRQNAWDAPVVVDPTLREHVTFRVANVAETPLPNASYDVVTGFNFLYYYHPEPMRNIARNMLNGLRRGGYFLRDTAQRNDSDWQSFVGELGLRPVSVEPEWQTAVLQVP